jgi:hypothetical protein
MSSWTKGDSMVASEAKVRVLRGQGGGSPWQIVCADCGPLETVADEQSGMEVGRAHLLRSHDGGGLAMDIGPYRVVDPRGHVESDVEGEVTEDVEGRATLDALAAWLERQGPLPADASGLEQLGRALRASRHELEGDGALDGDGHDSVPAPETAAEWSGWRRRGVAS